MIKLWDGKENLNDWKRSFTYNKFPVWVWKLMCFLKIKHNWLLMEWHCWDPKKDKEIELKNQFGIEECVYCEKKRRVN